MFKSNLKIKVFTMDPNASLTLLAYARSKVTPLMQSLHVSSLGAYSGPAGPKGPPLGPKGPGPLGPKGPWVPLGPKGPGPGPLARLAPARCARHIPPARLQQKQLQAGRSQENYLGSTGSG